MRNIKLHFTDSRYLIELLSDKDLESSISYLQPKQLDSVNIALTDPIDTHSRLDTEVVILTIFAKELKRLFFSNSNFQIEFLNPYANEQKGGLHHNGSIIIDSTDLELIDLSVTVRKS